jgi:hypothetical protein
MAFVAGDDDRSLVIHNDDGHIHVVWSMLEQPEIGVEATGRAAYTDDREIGHGRPGVHGRSIII